MLLPDTGVGGTNIPLREGCELWVGCAPPWDDPRAPFCTHSAPTMHGKRSRCSFSRLEVILIVCLALMIALTVVLLVLHFLDTKSDGKWSCPSPSAPGAAQGRAEIKVGQVEVSRTLLSCQHHL